jgi:hypothetical protein
LIFLGASHDIRPYLDGDIVVVRLVRGTHSSSMPDRRGPAPITEPRSPIDQAGRSNTDVGKRSNG